ncbi:TPA: penicillin-binding protein activator [Stenotrophomonas maltophilia]|nr:penicillin-binding protein activator [Stenotrophomonas maltophilia]HDS1027145.1 penicillin-binding protein activator [Stenotrophomonas maltophilia]HDS1029078.1 penicillin-binding protein activator [Stenotrophomonas maltophilia]HDS1036020.1 penicillin-binding protein activator [Stenotrophomonas maltophilia]
MNKPAARISALSLSLMLLAGCATTSLTSAPESPAQSQALALIEQGKPRDAALQLEAQAATLRGTARSNTLADAAWAWHLAGDSARARSLLAQLTARQLSGASLQRFQLASAELALADKQPAQALALLKEHGDNVHPSLRTRWYLARANALQASGDSFAAATERARAHAGLAGTARNENQAAIAGLLGTLDDATLRSRAAALPANDPLYNFAGRALIARGLPLPRPFDREGAAQFDTSKRPPAMSDGYRPPAKMAVLLPLSGRLATAAQPVRDGLLSAYYGESRRRPDINFFDTAGTPAGALAAYDKAVASGADFVVGPLGRDEVDAVYGRQPLQVPVLALNRGKDAPPAGSAGFSLAPEDDGIVAAEYMRGRERNRALVINSNDDTGRRAAAAFAQRFAQRGGQVAATVAVGDAVGDIGAQVRNAGQIDAVFLAVRAPQARLLAPQLALAGAGGATRVGTSQLTTGSGKAEEDVALDGIIYPNEAWNVRSVSGVPSAAQVAQTLPSARGAAGRLFAFGADAWKISAYLEKLSNEGGLDGATGTLYLDSNGNILRQPAWSTFSGGRPMPIAGGR